ncbi:response regulator transcription factor [Gordonia sp. CPCC 205515]|uniref:response regulator n=1 Tax=Gordonia sp. CPCC 205515 TaxID=3140791 RepID=UPI003AF3D4F1
MITVVVADDQTAIREALAVMLSLVDDLDVVATAANGREAVDAVATHGPQVLLTDLRMPVLDGAAATAEVCERFPDTAVVVLTTYDDEASILSALQAGARGYLTKEAGRDEIATAIRVAAAGQSVLDPAVQARLVAAVAGGGPSSANAAPATTGLEVLTARETEVLELIAQGLSNREIARRLVVSDSTVKTHINNIFTKLDLRDRSSAMRFAFQHGLGS